MSKRIKFFLGHLSASFFIVLVVMGVVFFLWYQVPLAKAVGVTQIFLMMLVIDVIAGPILGFLVYKENKKTLKIDLIIVILIQFSALGYGVYTIEQGRPVWLAYHVDRFELIRKNEIFEESIANTSPRYQKTSWFKPQFVGVTFAKNNHVRNDEMFAEVFGGISIAQKPERYVPLEKVKPQIQQRAQNLKYLEYYNDPKVVKTTLARYPQATAFVPLKANAVDMTVLIDREKGEVVKIVDLRPWN
ncbi:MAG: type IV pilin accessory protein [Acinetobacter sp. GWC1_38_13]|uniref:TfpX/TfpZ family type IV pilin accessory protein n=1 Tax=Acinetobacter sp. GWC1_38_13 TaxID=1797234 RepID=UPI0008C90A6A|nr:TfpX/TfpZ family type IV pilin accessory protein [Acinetobacter sp. GWC1_38_13]OFW45301.1 MAG: type IV pilin accessory protein [Acinetobacter sp. GWC1_38_13]HAV57802.1 type IV pilin accessory protein [Acinetobacter junii]